MERDKRIVMIAGNGFDEMEVKVPLEFFQKNNVHLDVLTAYKELGVPIEGKHGFRLESTITGDDLNSDVYDAVLITGGFEGPDRVRGHERVLEFLRKMNENGKLICAICHGPQVLFSADFGYGKILNGKKATCYPNIQIDMKNAGGDYQRQDVVIDGNLITSDRPERSLAWSEAILQAL